MNNTVERTISGTIFLAIMIGALLTSPVIFAFVMMFSIALMMIEYIQMGVGKSFKTAQALSIISGLLIYLFIFLYKGYGLDPKYLFLISFPVCGIFITLLYEKNVESYHRHPYLISAILYVALPFALTNFIIFDGAGEYKPMALLSLFIITWASDVGAYVIGMLFGQKSGHKLFPSISPKKSWEGFFGGLFFAITAACLLCLFKLTDFGLIHTISISLIINLFGVLGDLIESQLKRNFGVKDSGKFMPGHGGLLDRFDGALISFPAAIAYIKLFSLI
ncbi:MAG: phosphatidate cytidylyltransferase [Rikenellaceae bacterium]